MKVKMMALPGSGSCGQTRSSGSTWLQMGSVRQICLYQHMSVICITFITGAQNILHGKLYQVCVSTSLCLHEPKSVAAFYSNWLIVRGKTFSKLSFRSTLLAPV